jgi:hypothetical protein
VVSRGPFAACLGTRSTFTRSSTCLVTDGQAFMSQPSDLTSVPPQSASAPPLASFDPGGVASVISYQTPESTSYEGRHVLKISDYGLSDFAAVVASASQNPAEPVGSSGSGPVPGTPATAGPSLADSVLVPRAVVLSDSTMGTNNVIALAPFDLTDRLAALTWAHVQAAAGADKQVEVYRSLGGLLDYRVRDISQARKPVVPQTGSGNRMMAPASRNGGSSNGNGGSGGGSQPYIETSITSPDSSNPQLTGPSNGLNLPVSGTFVSTAGTVVITVDLLTESLEKVHEATATITGAAWTATLPVTTSGTWKVRATAVSQVVSGLQVSAIVNIVVTLSGGTVNGNGPAPTPSVSITSPTRNAVILLPEGSPLTGSALAQVTGSADNGGGSAITVSISADGGPANTVNLTPTGGTSFSFTTSVLLSGEGSHTITATAVNQDKVSAPAVTVPISLEVSQPVQPLDRRLVLIEKIAISSFLGNFGAGRLVKTFSLLPGEQTVISVDTYTKDETTAKSASSILDSTATECGADFEDTVNNENNTKASNSDATTASISAEVGVSWGWGNASIKAGYTNSANSSREDTTKTVTNALAKHTSKASGNRTVSVNTEFSQTTSTGNTTDTTRTLKNINVSRVLNFVFRQMTQEHTAIVHLTDATLGYYAVDLLLDAKGNPQTGPDGSPVTRESFTEYTLPEIADFQKNQMTTATTSNATLESHILNVLSSIPDYTGTTQSLVEQITPTAPDGTPDPTGTYLRVKPNLNGIYQAPGGTQFTVPGIILGVSTHVMRTDQLLCDALLGEGDALDTYSHALQDAAIAERQVALAERNAAVARENLAQSIVSSKDADMASAWQKIFPQPMSVPATVTVPATPNGAQSIP